VGVLCAPLFADAEAVESAEEALVLPVTDAAATAKVAEADSSPEEDEFELVETTVTFFLAVTALRLTVEML
jgi:hypothetical protein